MSSGLSHLFMAGGMCRQPRWPWHGSDGADV